jgi:hypothetical protein
LIVQAAGKILMFFARFGFPLVVDGARNRRIFVRHSDGNSYVHFVLDPNRSYSLPLEPWHMIEGPVLFPSIIQPRWLCTVGVMLNWAGLEGIADALARSEVSFSFAIVRNPDRLGASDVLFPIAIKVTSDAGWKTSVPALRCDASSTAVCKIHLFGRSIRCNCRGPSEMYRRN